VHFYLTNKEDQDMTHRAERHSYTGTIALAFLIGGIVGAGGALLLAPEPGSRMRKRLLDGAKAAQEELAGVASETRDAFGMLTKDARQTLRQTASRLNAALGATREAISGEVDPGIRKLPTKSSNRKP
jgi:gas vesicle protein